MLSILALAALAQCNGTSCRVPRPAVAVLASPVAAHAPAPPRACVGPPCGARPAAGVVGVRGLFGRRRGR